jgi:thioredoxin 1
MGDNMKKLALLLILLAALLFTAGCVGNSTNSQVSLEKNAVVKMTKLEQINTSLEKGPVFIRMGSKWCPACRSLKPVLENLSAEYGGKATIGSVDVDKNPELAEYFGVEVIPDSSVIVGIENGKYVYMQKDGNVSVNRSQARFVELNESKQKVFEETLNSALLQQEKNKSK